MWEAIAAAQDATIRLHGRDYYRDRKIIKREKQGIRAVLDGYRALRAEAKP